MERVHGVPHEEASGHVAFVYGSRFAGMKAPAAGRAGGWRKGVRC